MLKNVNLIYSSHALSFTNTKLSFFTGIPLEQRNRIQIKSKGTQNLDLSDSPGTSFLFIDAVIDSIS